MSGSAIESHFSDFYTQKKSVHLYPTEFVIRAFLGSYPELKLDKSTYPGSKILDLGYGDGRNMQLLHNLGFEICGVEIDNRINELTVSRLSEIGIKADLRCGSNSDIPFDDAFFDYMLACHACYYVKEGERFEDNIQEIARVMRKGGTVICSLPMASTYILKDAENLGNGHMRIRNDSFGLRNGSIFRAFADEADIAKAFSPYFKNFSIGFSDDNYWGIRQKVWLVRCVKH